MEFHFSSFFQIKGIYVWWYGLEKFVFRALSISFVDINLILTNYIYDLRYYIYSLYYNHKIAHWRPRSTRKILDNDGRKETNWPTNLHITVAAVVALLLKRTQLLFRRFEVSKRIISIDWMVGWVARSISVKLSPRKRIKRIRAKLCLTAIIERKR